MYAGQKHLDNLCVMVDRNNGQLDLANRMVDEGLELLGRVPSSHYRDLLQQWAEYLVDRQL